MGNCLSTLLSFCSGDIDINQNEIPDNQELFQLIQILIARLDELKSTEEARTGGTSSD